MSIDYNNALANPENVVQGDKYRFTVLTPRLIRMEYSEDGIFEDHLTTLVLNRKTPKVEYTKKEDKKYIEITTSYFRLTYEKNKPFYCKLFNLLINRLISHLMNDYRNILSHKFDFILFYFLQNLKQ